MAPLQEKIKELKRRAAPINKRALSVDASGQLQQLQERDSLLDQGVIEGYLVIWGKKNLYGEKLVKGCCAKSIREHGPGSNNSYEIKFLNQHKQDDPLSLFEILREDDIGLYFRTKQLDDIESAQRVIKQLRSKTLNNFSIGFDYVWDKIEYDEHDDSLVLLEIILLEGSVVSIPADLGTYAIRSMEDIEDLHDDIDSFIKQLPRKHQMEARSLFARQKSLIDLDQPFEQRNTALVTSEPVGTGVDYKHLLQNLNLFK